MLWEEFLLTAQGGCPISLLESGAKVDGSYRLDADLDVLSINPDSKVSSVAKHTCVVNRIQVICPAAEFAWIVEDIDVLASLSEADKGKAILIQYSSDDDDRARVCFLEQNSGKRDRFVQAMTALWLEKRNEQSLWF